MKHHIANLSKAATLAFASSLLLFQAAGQEPVDRTVEFGAETPYMLGDWSGERTKLANRGVTLNLIYVDDVLSDTRRNAGNWSRVRGTLDIDFDRAGMAAGLKFHITGMWQAGSNLGTRLGTIVNPSSLASINLFRLDSWWFEKALAQNKLFVRAGQFAGLDFYGVQPYGDSFINLSLGYAMGNLITATHETFAPAATPAFEIRYLPTRRFYIKSAIFSGNRDPFHDDGNGLHFRFKDAPVIAAEAGYRIDPDVEAERGRYPSSYAFGATVNTGPFSNIVTGRRTRTNYLLYCTVNQQLYRSRARESGALDVTFTFDWTPEEITRNFSQLASGLRYHGLVRGRRQDTAAAGFVYSRMSGVWNRSRSQAGLVQYGAEKLLELNYAARVRRWFTLQPVFQYYIETGATPERRNTIIFGVRTLIVL